MPVQEHDGVALGPPERPAFFESLNAMDEYVSKLPAAPISPTRAVPLYKNKPCLLVCHDFKGGYAEETHAQGYTFERWACTDLMVYFSHKRVSLPPAGWIRAARFHGTKILGTLIFEWDQSKSDLKLLLDGPHPKWRTPVRVELSEHFADQLVLLAAAYDIDGFLVNVETSLQLNPFQNPILQRLDRLHNAVRLRRWVQYFREKGQQYRPVWHVVWYDSVTYPEGQLAWQDAMTIANAPYIQAASSAFINYTWSHPERCKHGFLNPCLEHTVSMADHCLFPRYNVFMGVDVFGRNCLGGHDATKAIDLLGLHLGNEGFASGKRYNLSVALFAPGWTWEHDSPPARSWDAWWKEDCEFWEDGLHCITKYFPNRAYLWHGDSTHGYGFRTNFCLGSGTHWFVQGRNVYHDKEHGWSDQGVSAPKPTLAWPNVKYVLNESGTYVKAAVHTHLSCEDAWSGSQSLCVEVSSESYIPILALAPMPREASSRSATLRVCAKGAKIVPCIHVGSRLLRGCESIQRVNGWQLYKVELTLPEDIYENEVHVILGVSGSVRIGQIEISSSQYLEADATWHNGVLSWSDVVPWATCYEVYTVREDPVWIGTVSHTLSRNQTIMYGDEETIAQIQSVGAWPDEAPILAMPS